MIRTIELACLRDGCGMLRTIAWNLPEWAITPMLLCWHNSHEGHPFSMVLDGVKVWPLENTEEVRAAETVLRPR